MRWCGLRAEGLPLNVRVVRRTREQCRSVEERDVAGSQALETTNATRNRRRRSSAT